MSAVTFDTDAVIQRLRRTGMSEEHAREFVQVLRDTQAEFVTKSDLDIALRDLKKDLQIWTGGASVVIIAAMAALKIFA